MLSSRGTMLAVGGAGAAVSGYVYGVEEFVLLAVAAGVLLVTGAVTVRYRQRWGRRAVHVSVRVPVAEVTARHGALVELRVTNGGRHRLPCLVLEEPRQRWSVSHPGLGERRPPGTGAPPHRPRERRPGARSLRLPELPAGADAVVWVPVPTSRRGLLTLSGIGVWCEDPLRLFARPMTVAPPAHVVVYPEPDDGGPPVAASAPHPARRPEHAVARSGGQSGDELSGLRPYAPGDRLSRLHWPALARSGDLVVREFADSPGGSLTLLLDLRPEAHGDGSVDRVVSRAAALGLRMVERGVRLELCTSAGDRLVVGSGAPGRQVLLRALALLGPASAAPAVMRRWGGRPTGGAVWTTGAPVEGEVVLLTTAAGSSPPALPEPLRMMARVVVVP